MAVSEWPETLPACLILEGQSEGMSDGRIRTQTDTGPAKVRLRSSAMPRPLQGRMRLTGTQLATLRTFVEDTLIGGTLPFTFKDQVTGSSILVRFAGSLPSWTRASSGKWDILLDLEILP